MGITRKVRRAIYRMDYWLFEEHLLAVRVIASLLEWGGLALILWWAFHHVTITIK